MTEWWVLVDAVVRRYECGWLVLAHLISNHMPRAHSVSPATGKSTPDYYIHTTSANFVDVHGRSLLLRGVNFAGSSKTPEGSQTQVLDGFWEDAEGGKKGFSGRPLNLDDGSADVHLARLKGWGFNMLRYVVTWEALEHEGP